MIDLTKYQHRAVKIAETIDDLRNELWADLLLAHPDREKLIGHMTVLPIEAEYPFASAVDKVAEGAATLLELTDVKLTRRVRFD